MSVNLVLNSPLTSDNARRVRDEEQNDSRLFLSTRRVGIGTSTPSRQLDVRGNGGRDGGIAASNSEGSFRVNIWVDESPSPQQGRIDVGGSGGSKLRINNGGGEVSFGGDVTIDGGLQVAGLVDVPGTDTGDLIEMLKYQHHQIEQQSRKLAELEERLGKH